MLVHWIWLATRPNISDRIKRDVLDYFSDAEDVFYADENALARCPDITEQAVGALMDKKLDDAWQIIDTCKRMAIHILTYCDAAYPSRLKNIADPPLVLYYRGRLPDFDAQPFIGVVGTRKASAYGLSSARKLGYQIACCGGAVVSGAAEGIDAAAMSGALTGNGTVVGVLGCGVDIVYPLCNKGLFADVERYGCLLSEFAPGTPPMKWHFPKRNRIMSGLSNGVLVVEAPQRSGALITARQAAEQGEKKALKVAQKPAKPEKKQPAKKVETKKVIDNGQNEPYIDLNKIESSLSEEEKVIVRLLANGQRLVDDVIAESGKNTGTVLASLTLLEVKGIVRRLPGRFIALKGRE